MENYTTEELRAFRDKKKPIPDIFQADITSLQEAVTHDQIINKMKCLSNKHDPRASLRQHEFMLSTIDLLFRNIHIEYFSKELIRRDSNIRSKEYYQDNKEAIKQKANEKFSCECGGRYTTANKAQHMRSKKHQNYFNA